MEAEFWHNKWQANQIGFHEDAVHPMLQAHWAGLSVDPKRPVFVPLCGKSNDMLWLRDRGHGVVGVELSEIAVEAFFRENGIDFTREEQGAFIRYRGGAFTLMVGDIFDLRMEDLGGAAAFYDRASLIALPQPTRKRYAAHLRTLFAPGARGLLIALDYPQDLISPPPFVVDSAEVTQLYSSWCVVERLAEVVADVKGTPGTEFVFALTVV